MIESADFDDLEVRLAGEPRKAFLVGLRPMRESAAGMEEHERLRKAVHDQLKKCELFAQVVTRRGEALGISLDAFAHKRHGFEHGWDPVAYPYCGTGWGAYNFNLYFLHAGFTEFEDNFGENETRRKRFAELLGKIEEKAEP